jgi:transcriptional regulator GlxA family with amidase domain
MNWSDRYRMLRIRDVNVVRRPLSIGCLLVNDFSLSTFSRFVDYLSFAASGSPRCVGWTVMSHAGRNVRASSGVKVSVDSRLIDQSAFDYIAVLAGAPQCGDQLEDGTAAYLTGAAGSGVKLLGISTGSFILCRLGLMRGRTCCVDWRYHQDFMAEFPDTKVLSDRHFVVDEDRITCAGGRSATHLAAYLVEQPISDSAVWGAPGTWLHEELDL